MIIYCCRNDCFYGVTLDKEIIICIPKYYKVIGKKRRSILFNILGNPSRTKISISIFKTNFEIITKIELEEYKNLDWLIGVTSEFAFLKEK